MTRRAIVRVPGSASNLGAGFDCVGLAVDRWLTLSATLGHGAPAGEPALIERAGTLAGLGLPPERDHILAGFHAACEAAGRPAPGGLHVRVSSEIPVARGLGSSAAAVVAGAVAADALLGLGLGDGALAAVAAGVEGHPDNVAAALTGGATLAVAGHAANLTISRLQVHAGLAFIFAVPDRAIETRQARAVLPHELPYATAVRAAALAAALIQGLATGDEALLAAALDDVLHVPFRRSLVPGFDQVTQAARAAGAYGATFSGSGSTIVAIGRSERAASIAPAMRSAWEELGVAAECFTTGARTGGYTLTVREECDDASPATQPAHQLP